MKKKSFLFIVFCVLFFSCSNNGSDIKQENIINSLKQLEFEYSPKFQIRRTNSDSHKIDWALVAIADGGGAAVGAEIAKYSGNFYAIAASAVGVGIYASYSEYERQIADTTSNSIIVAIDPNDPINTNWSNEINEIEVGLGTTVGRCHNEILTELFCEGFSFEESDSIEFIWYVLDRYVDLTDENINVDEITDLILASGISNHSIQSETRMIINMYNMYALNLDSEDRFEYTEDFVTTLSLYNRPDEDVILSSIMTTYYSSYLWNYYIVNPDDAIE